MSGLRSQPEGTDADGAPNELTRCQIKPAEVGGRGYLIE